ncbi:amino acid ABC transporter permease [Bradyrhizobium japonicum]|uniref:amino acid ABC transporter permease n=1 Tax=Bradyrhizobium japonicum TaxID=375 RepID=UPI0004AEEB5D|nr:amino acid ABC transporter permease [Bradyrhizobium japonicum]
MDFDFSPILISWRFLAGGLVVTILLSISTIVCATILGSGIGLGRAYGKRWLCVPLAFYVDSMRALPILVILVWIFFAFPIAFGETLPPFLAAILALTLHISAYVSEIVRAGVVSVRFGQTRAGLALGMSSAQIICKIILPQAIVRILPPYGSILSITIKETAVATVIAVPEYMHQSEVIASQSLRPIEVFATAMVVYFILLFPVTRGVDFVYRRIAHLGRS